MQWGCRNPFVMLILIKCTVSLEYNIDETTLLPCQVKAGAESGEIP
jgi:hypothetical protein